MHVGMSLIFQSAGGLSDREVYQAELRMAELAEPLGFQSIWGVEHHFTDYTMCPDVLQFLTYMAGRSERLQLGSMVVVLPWHDPVRVAEQVCMLDHISGGRVIFGIGRGLGRVEFEGFRVPMDESRQRFVEAAEMVLSGLEHGEVKYEGTYHNQPLRQLRPGPWRTFRGRTYAASISPESSRIMAELGVGLLIIPQKPWETIEADLAAYREIYREVNGTEAPPPVVASWVFCDPDPGRARDFAEQYVGGYYNSVLTHYELTAGHLEATKGYEYYGKVADHLRAEQDSGVGFFTDLQVWGTPEQCFERAMNIRSLVGNDTFIAVCSYGGMAYDDAERNLRLFAGEVMPRLQEV
ncbi:MAG: LLM class flavin-dependent oxidoreductase [Acidimicrobiia bacterium]